MALLNDFSEVIPCLTSCSPSEEKERIGPAVPQGNDPGKHGQSVDNIVRTTVPVAPPPAQLHTVPPVQPPLPPAPPSMPARMPVPPPPPRGFIGKTI